MKKMATNLHSSKMRPQLQFSISFLLLIAVISGLVLPSNLQGQPTAAYERGETVRVPAPTGFSSSKLGIGKPVGGASFSTVEVVESNGRVATVEEDAYNAGLRLQQSKFQLNATASALGLASARWKDASRYRYAHLQVRHISRVKRLDTKNPPPRDSNADYFISTVYYGWSLDVMVRGRSKTFTRGVSAHLQDVVEGGVGGDFRQVARENELTTEVKLRGLASQDGSPGIALSPDQVQSQFQIGKPQPILVEYTFLKDTETEPIKWSERSIGPGRYRLEEVGITLANQKASGEDWDPLSPLPDPLVSLRRNGQFVATVGGKDNTTTVRFGSGRMIDLNPGTELSFRVVDEDVTEHDFAGMASARYNQLSQKHPGEKIPLRTEGQVQSGWIKVSSVKQFGPDPSSNTDAPAKIASVYEGPSGIFQVGKPKGWKDQYRAKWTDNGLYRVQFMLSPPSAEKADLGGYLSEGARLNIWLPPEERRTGANVQQWAPQSIRSLLQANIGFTFVDSSTVRVAGTRGIAYTLTGNSPQISEPEKTKIIYAATPRYTARIDLVSPSRLWNIYKGRFREMMRSFRVTGSPPQ